jgi:hypothetical protein
MERRRQEGNDEGQDLRGHVKLSQRILNGGIMPENMMNSDHKATNKKFRDGYDNIKWGKKNANLQNEVDKHERGSSRKANDGADN